MMTWDMIKRVLGMPSTRPRMCVDVARDGSESTTVTVHRQIPPVSTRLIECRDCRFYSAGNDEAPV